MLDKLRDRATRIFAETSFCTLASTGPAGLMASMVRCTGQGTNLYLLVPDTSDHLFNLENEPEVAVTAEGWSLRGTAKIVPDCQALFSAGQSQWHTVVRVMPSRLQLLPMKDGPINYAETIDFDL